MAQFYYLSVHLVVIYYHTVLYTMYSLLSTKVPIKDPKKILDDTNTDTICGS